MITPAARKIARSRAGNGVPSDSMSGSVSTPASVIAPRTPATDIAAMTCGGTGARPPGLARNSVKRPETKIQPKRSAAKPKLIAST